MPVILHQGDCNDELKAIPYETIDSVVTDPPSGVAVWHDVLRVLKPGGHLPAFATTRTYHRMAVAIEDAGFEIRDQIG